MPHAAFESQSAFLNKSRRFALALRLVYVLTPFDSVQCFDYAGVAYELLLAAVPGPPDARSVQIAPVHVGAHRWDTISTYKAAKSVFAGAGACQAFGAVAEAVHAVQLAP